MLLLDVRSGSVGKLDNGRLMIQVQGTIEGLLLLRNTGLFLKSKEIVIELKQKIQNLLTITNIENLHFTSVNGTSQENFFHYDPNIVLFQFLKKGETTC